MIETLQTLTCNGAADGTVDKRDEHIAAFLENLKKEQQASQVQATQCTSIDRIRSLYEIRRCATMTISGKVREAGAA